MSFACQMLKFQPKMKQVNFVKVKHIIAVSLILAIFLSSTASAGYSLHQCIKDGYYCRAATERLSSGNCKADYTVIPTKDPFTFHFKDCSRGKITYLRWDFGDGGCLQGTKITKALKNPTHTFKKPGHYTGCLTIKCEGVKGKLWIHKDLKIKVTPKCC